jgi:hypothetical protein
MTIHIIGTGETAKKWDGSGPSIGVNDCAKWGYPVNYLLLLNQPHQFQSSRLETIISTKAGQVYTNVPSSWEKYFQHVNQVYFRSWSSGSKVSKNTLYHSKTSPFVGISLAYSWGFNKIVLWGVDFVNHHRYGKDQSGHVQEMMRYMSFIKALKDQVKVFIGSKGTAFDDHLPVWSKELLSV